MAPGGCGARGSLGPRQAVDGPPASPFLARQSPLLSTSKRPSPWPQASAWRWCSRRWGAWRGCAACASWPTPWSCPRPPLLRPRRLVLPPAALQRRCLQRRARAKVRGVGRQRGHRRRHLRLNRCAHNAFAALPPPHAGQASTSWSWHPAAAAPSSTAAQHLAAARRGRADAQWVPQAAVGAARRLQLRLPSIPEQRCATALVSAVLRWMKG